MAFNYDIEFGQNSKTLTFSTSKTMHLTGWVLCLAFIGFTVCTVLLSMPILYTLFIGALAVVFVVGAVNVSLSKHQLILTENSIRLLKKDLINGEEDRTIMNSQIMSLFKRVEILKGKYGAKHHLYCLCVESTHGEVVDLTALSSDVRKIDEIKKIVGNYTGITNEARRYEPVLSAG